jgi:hypothetical protein
VERCDAASDGWGGVQEFVDQLLGKLEAQLKGTPQVSAYTSHGGTFSAAVSTSGVESVALKVLQVSRSTFFASRPGHGGQKQHVAT